MLACDGGTGANEGRRRGRGGGGENVKVCHWDWGLLSTIWTQKNPNTHPVTRDTTQALVVTWNESQRQFPLM